MHELPGKFTILFADDDVEQRLYGSFLQSLARCGVIEEPGKMPGARLLNDTRTLEDADHYLFHIILQGRLEESLKTILREPLIDILITDIFFEKDDSIRKNSTRQVGGVFNLFYALSRGNVLSAICFSGYADNREMTEEDEYRWGSNLYRSIVGRDILAVTKGNLGQSGIPAILFHELPKIRQRYMRWMSQADKDRLLNTILKLSHFDLASEMMIEDEKLRRELLETIQELATIPLHICGQVRGETFQKTFTPLTFYPFPLGTFWNRPEVPQEMGEFLKTLYREDDLPEAINGLASFFRMEVRRGVIQNDRHRNQCRAKASPLWRAILNSIIEELIPEMDYHKQIAIAFNHEQFGGKFLHPPGKTQAQVEFPKFVTHLNGSLAGLLEKKDREHLLHLAQEALESERNQTFESRLSEIKSYLRSDFAPGANRKLGCDVEGEANVRVYLPMHILQEMVQYIRRRILVGKMSGHLRRVTQSQPFPVELLLQDDGGGLASLEEIRAGGSTDQLLGFANRASEMILASWKEGHPPWFYDVRRATTQVTKKWCQKIATDLQCGRTLVLMQFDKV